MMNSVPSVSVPSTLDLFNLPGTQFAIQQNLITEHRPIATISHDSPITFIINTAKDEYLQLKDLLFRLRLRINIEKKDGSTPTLNNWTSNVSCVNYLLHSIFKQINVEIQGKQVTISPQTYAYKALFESLIGFTEDARNSHLSSSIYSKDSSANPEVIDATRAKSIVAKSGTKNGPIFELVSKPHLDLSFQEKALLGGTSVKIEFIPHDPSFYLMVDTDVVTPKVEFLDAALFIHRSKVSPILLEAHELALEKGNAKYPICRNEVKSFTVSKGTMNVNIDNVVTGKLPRRALVALVSNEAYNGSYKKNPFNFKNYKLNFIAAYMDGISHPSIPYTPDFVNNITTREYIGLFEAFNQLTSDSTITLTQDEWKSGKTMYGFNFAADLSNGCIQENHLNPQKYGSMGLQMRFAEALNETINVLIYLEFDNLIGIDSSRQVTTDFV